MKCILAKFYQNSLGNEPVRDFLLEFSKEDKKVIGIDIMTVEYGWPIGMPTCRPLGEGLYEVRSKISAGREVRILFSIEANEMILLHGFIKKPRKLQTRIYNWQRKEEVA